MKKDGWAAGAAFLKFQCYEKDRMAWIIADSFSLKLRRDKLSGVLPCHGVALAETDARRMLLCLKESVLR